MAGKGVVNAEFVVSSVDEILLKCLLEFHYLTIEQVTRLLYSRSSLTYVRHRLKVLADQEYLQRTYSTRPVPIGRAKTVYRLGRRGIKYLETAGYAVGFRYRPSEHRTHGELYLAHTLAINDVLIAARLLSRLHKSIELKGFRHDIDLKRSARKVVIDRAGKTESITVVPDAWLDFSVSGIRKKRYPVLLEVDRGTAAVRDFKKKIRALLIFVKEPYQTQFGTKYVSVAFAVDTGAYERSEACLRRVADIKRWTQEEVKESGDKKLATLFYFTSLPRGFDLDPKRFFLAPSWDCLSRNLPVSLLDLPQSA